jgi:hypothetical protein
MTTISARAAARLERPADAAHEIGGPLRKQIDGVVENWLIPAPGNNPAMTEMFADRDKQPLRNLLPWSGEFFGKYLTASAQMIRLTGNKKLQATVEKVVARAIALQAEDGYLGPWSKEFRLRKGAPNCERFNLPQVEPWDAWGHYHAMIGLLLWHQDTRDPILAAGQGGFPDAVYAGESAAYHRLRIDQSEFAEQVRAPAKTQKDDVNTPTVTNMKRGYS